MKIAQAPTLTRVKPKNQITIPKAVSDRIGIKVGDLLEAQVSPRGVLLVPKMVVDKKLEALRAEIRKGLESGPAKPFDFKALRARVRRKVAQGKKANAAR